MNVVRYACTAIVVFYNNHVCIHHRKKAQRGKKLGDGDRKYKAIE